MTSHPPDKCCFVAFKHEGEAQGNVEKFGGYDCYTAYPSDRSTKFGVLLFPDFMGYGLVNAKLIADQLAANGFFTLIPDLWEGDNVPPGFQSGNEASLAGWFQKHNPEHVTPIAAAVVKAMREDCGVEKLGGVGYCLGAKYVCRFLAKGQGLDAGYFAHPSLVTEDELRGVAGPLTIAAAETDHLFPADKRHESEQTLKEIGIPYQLTLYSGVDHGFALKADLTVPNTKFMTDTAFFQAVNWFDYFLKNKA